jgi:hypothetical protein
MANKPSSQGGKPPQSAPRPTYDPPPRRAGGNQRQGIAEAAIKSFIRSIAGSVGRAIARAMMGGRR